MNILESHIVEAMLEAEYHDSGIKSDVARAMITAYERHVTTTRLRELLAERGPGEIIATEALDERETRLPCTNCGRPIEPGRLYVVDGPQHIKCDTKDEAGC